MPQATEPFIHPHFIIGEGPEDVGFVKYLIASHNLPHCHVQHTGEGRYGSGGKSKFKTKLERAQASRTFDILTGIMLIADSDGDHDDSFQYIRSQVAGSGLSAPDLPRQPSVGMPSVQIFVLPPNEEGALETYIKEACAAQHPHIAAHVEPFVQAVTDHSWTATQKSKLWLRAQMAAYWKADPGINFRSLMKSNHQLFNASHNSLNGIVEALRAFLTP